MKKTNKLFETFNVSDEDDSFPSKEERLQFNLDQVNKALAAGEITEEVAAQWIKIFENIIQ